MKIDLKREEDRGIVRERMTPEETAKAVKGFIRKGLTEDEAWEATKRLEKLVLSGTTFGEAKRLHDALVAKAKR